jgi:hypothetical protein
VQRTGCHLGREQTPSEPLFICWRFDTPRLRPLSAIALTHIVHRFFSRYPFWTAFPQLPAACSAVLTVITLPPTSAYSTMSSSGNYQQYGGNPYGREEAGYGQSNPYGGTAGGYGASNPYGGTVCSVSFNLSALRSWSSRFVGSWSI